MFLQAEVVNYFVLP